MEILSSVGITNSLTDSCAELLGKVEQILGGDVNRRLRGRLTTSGAVLIGPGDVAGAQTAFSGGEKIVGVRRHHHAFAGCQIERRAGGKIDARLRLVVACDLSAEDRIPRQMIAAREV